MKIQKYDGTAENRILTAMILNSAVLGRVFSKWEDRGLFANKWANIIAGWCIKYFDRHKRAPRKTITNLLESWASKSKDKKDIPLIEKFISQLSEDYDERRKGINADYIVDEAAEHFNCVKIRKANEAIEGDLAKGEWEKALERIQSFQKFEMGMGEGIDVLRDVDALKRAFAEKQDALFTYPGPLGEFFGDSLSRDRLIGLMGPNKRGKSQWLLDFGWRALMERLKVAYFQAGDLSEAQIMRRFSIRAAEHPRKRGVVKYPRRIRRDEEDDTAIVRFVDKEFEENLNWKMARKAFKQIVNENLKTENVLLKLSVHANSTLSVKGIYTILEDWARSDWVPDVIIVDYPDVMLHGGGYRMDSRDRVNETWKSLKSLTQQLHCLVVVATQTNAASFDAYQIKRKHFSEDNRKLAHVDGMIGLNQTETEKKMGVIRLNWNNLRDDEYYESKFVHVAGCAALMNPSVCSCW